jgi:hypothetical protein
MLWFILETSSVALHLPLERDATNLLRYVSILDLNSNGSTGNLRLRVTWMRLRQCNKTFYRLLSTINIFPIGCNALLDIVKIKPGCCL